MAENMKFPKVFISYSWKPKKNKDEAIELAERLSSDGVQVIIDVWNLSEGQDKYQFMEQMVNDPEILRVLIICNKEYTDKANSKKGGVGTESLIISKEIYTQADQKKFIPVLFERDENGKEHIPTFIHSRIYIDLSQEDKFEEEYEKLLRNIFDKPESRRPPIGSPPPYITEQEPVFLRTAHKVRTIKNGLISDRQNTQIFIDDYYRSFLESLKDFEISEEEINKEQFLDELILKRIDALTSLRDDFIDFIDVLTTYSVKIDLDKINSFLNTMLEYLINQRAYAYPSGSRGSYSSDQFKFFIYELFLYIFTIFTDKERFDDLSKIVYNDFIINDEHDRATYALNYFVFNQPVESLDKLRNQRLAMNRYSFTADLLKQRADNKVFPFVKLQESDIFLYYLSLMQQPREQPVGLFRWIPKTSIYNGYRLTLLRKMVSLRQFEKLKSLFAVTTVDELKTKVASAIPIDERRTSRFELSFPSIKQAFNFLEIGTLK
jgi:hypothetical protein